MQDGFKVAIEQSNQEGMPEFVMFIFEHLQLIFFLSLLLIILLLVSSIGLLRRKNWAFATGCVE